MMPSAIPTTRRLLPLAVLLLFATACGGGPTAPSTGGSGSAPYTQTVTGSVSVFGTTRHALNIPRSGDLRLTLTWLAGNIDLDLYLTAPGCQSLYPLPQCGVVLASDSAVGTQEVIARTVTAGEAFAIFVDNLSTINATTYIIEIRID